MKAQEVKKERSRRKNLLREAIKSVTKPAAAEAGESPPEDSLDQLRALRGLVEGQIKRLMAELSSPTISS